MDNLLYKGFVALDDLKNRDAKNIKLKEDYLLRKGPAEDNAQTSNRKDLLLDYEIIIPKRSEFHAVKMLNDPMSIYNFLSSKNDPFFYYEDFQSKFVKELPKLLWQTEKMEDLGDFVLLFPNPDKRAVKHLDRKDDNCISFNMMQEYYDSIFNTTYNYPYKKKFTTALKQAFDRALNMRKIAEDMRMSKAVEFGLSDPLSLEPIDSKNRPLRTNILLKDEQQWERTYAKSENMHKTTAINAIRTDIVNLLKTDCNMKALVRLCDATWMENDQEHLIIDEDVPSLDQWKEYREYLKEIAMHLREIKLLKKKIMYIEEKFYGNTRFCVSGSKNRRSIDKMEIKKIVNRLVVKALIDTINKYDTLQNLWAALKMEVSAYSYQYETATNKMRPRNRDYFSQMWMDYMYHYPYTREEIDAIMDKDSLEDTKDKEDEDAGEDVGGVETVNPEDTKITIYNYEFNKIERLKIVYYLVSQSELT
jgi:hypothetical protein